MTEPENPDPADSGAVDEEEAAVNEALAVLTAGVSVTTAEDADGEVGEDAVGDGDDDDDGAPDEDAADALIAAMTLPPASEAPITFGDPDDQAGEPVVTAHDAAFGGDEAERIERLEDVTRALVSAATARDDGRVRRKVQASATGAAAAGAVPLILQLTGALNLSADEAAAVTAAAAALASFVGGYITPERRPTVDSEVVHEALKVQ